MNELQATAVMTSLILLRFALPLALTILFGLLMNRFIGQGYFDD